MAINFFNSYFLRTLCNFSSLLLKRKQCNSFLSLVRNELQKRRVNTVETKREAKRLRNASFKDFKNIVSLAVPHRGRIFGSLICFVTIFDLILLLFYCLI